MCPAGPDGSPVDLVRVLMRRGTAGQGQKNNLYGEEEDVLLVEKLEETDKEQTVII